MNKHYTLAEYQEALQGAGPKLKEVDPGAGRP